MQKNHLTRLGTFILVSLLLFLVGIFSLGDRKGWFQNTFIVNVYFDDVAGLESGAAVQISGLRAGKVNEINPPRKIGERVKLVLEIDEIYRDLIREDALARIETEGLVGNKILIVQPGSENSPLVDSGGQIHSKEPVRFDAISDRFYRASEGIENIVKGIDQITDSLRRGKGTLGRLITNPVLYNNLTSAAQSVDTAFSSFTKESKKITQILANLSISTENIVKKIENGEGTVGKLVGSDSLYNDMKASTSQFISVIMKLEEGVTSFAENMEALKHNWFFKGYYEERGYMNRAEFESNDEVLRKNKLALEQLRLDLQKQLESIIAREKAVREAEERLKNK